MEHKHSGNPVVHWWEHGNGLRTCHFNRPKANADETYIGKMSFKDGAWHSQLKGEESVVKHPGWGGFKQASQRIMDSVNGEELSEHD